jgi:hypothetical protein
VSKRIKPLISITIAAESASDKAGIPRKMFNRATPKTTNRPTNRNPPRKLKSLFVVRAYPESPRKIIPVPARAVAIMLGPFGRDKYMFSIGPRANPINPVIPKTTASPFPELAVLGRTNHINKNAPIIDTK